MESISGEIKIEKGFLEGLQKKVLEAGEQVWVDANYVNTLESEFEKVLEVAKNALALAAISRERLKKQSTPQGGSNNIG